MKKYAEGGIYTAEMGKPPQDIDGASAPPKRPMPKGMPVKRPAAKPPMPMQRRLPPEAGAGDVTPPPGAPGMPAMKKGGSVGSASRRADGIAKKGKTKGTFV